MVADETHIKYFSENYSLWLNYFTLICKRNLRIYNVNSPGVKSRFSRLGSFFVFVSNLDWLNQKGIFDLFSLKST